MQRKSSERITIKVERESDKKNYNKKVEIK